MESFIEIFEDFMFLNGVLQFKKSLSNLQSKELFSEVLMIMNPIVVYEFTKYLDDNQMIESSSFFKTQQASYFVRNLRNKSLKIKPSKSSQASNAIKKMGISFEDDIYDLTITIDQNQALHNMNFEQNVLDFDTNIETYESLIHIIQDTLKIIFSILELNYKEIFENENLIIFYDSEARLFEKKYQLEKYSYSTKLFFSNIKGSKLTKKDKNFILFNYRSIHSCTILPQNISPSIHVGTSKINSNNTIYKYIAINIEKIGQELMKMNTSFSQELLHLIEKNIPEIKFYSLNRRLRNNIHYNKINKLSDDDFNLVKNCQAIYIDTCLNFINSHLNINLTNEVISVTEYNRLALEKSIPLEELLHNHKEYYTSFLKTGSIERTNKKYESKVK